MTMKQIIIDALDDTAMVRKTNNGYTFWECELYADYRDELDASTASKIINADDNIGAFYQEIDNAYFECQLYAEDEIRKQVLKFIEEHAGEYDEIASEDEVNDALVDHVCYSFPYKHFLNQEFNVVLRIDSGNVNYGMGCEQFTVDGDDVGDIDPHSSLLWLVRQQGYTTRELLHEHEGNKFLESVAQERLGAPDSGTLTFLLRLTLEQLMDIKPYLRKNFITDDGELNTQDEDGYVVISKYATCGLFDSFNGGGSEMGIELEKEVKVPLNLIHTLEIDGEFGCYGVYETYGFIGSAWDCGLDFHRPKQVEAVA